MKDDVCFNLNITIDQKLINFCKKHYIKKLSIFGSFLRDDFNSNSDVDLLVEFEDGKTPGFFDLIDMENDLSVFFNGRKLDLRTPGELSVYVRDKIISNAKLIYRKND